MLHRVDIRARLAAPSASPLYSRCVSPLRRAKRTRASSRDRRESLFRKTPGKRTDGKRRRGDRGDRQVAAARSRPRLLHFSRVLLHFLLARVSGVRAYLAV